MNLSHDPSRYLADSESPPDSSELEEYGIKVVDDVSKLLIEGDLMDDSQKYQHEQHQMHQYLDASLGIAFHIKISNHL